MLDAAQNVQRVFDAGVSKEELSMASSVWLILEYVSAIHGS